MSTLHDVSYLGFRKTGAQSRKGPKYPCRPQVGPESLDFRVEGDTPGAVSGVHRGVSIVAGSPGSRITPCTFFSLAGRPLCEMRVCNLFLLPFLPCTQCLHSPTVISGFSWHPVKCAWRVCMMAMNSAARGVNNNPCTLSNSSYVRFIKRVPLKRASLGQISTLTSYCSYVILSYYKRQHADYY